MSHSGSDNHDDNKLGANIDVKVWASRATLDIIGLAGLGRDFDAIKDPGNELILTYQKIFSPGRGGQILAALFMIAPWLMRNLP